MIRAYTTLNNLEYTVYKPIVANLVKQFSTKVLNNPDIFVEYTEDADRFGQGMYDTDFSTQYNRVWLTIDYDMTHDDSYFMTNSIRQGDGLMLLGDKEVNFKVFGVPLTHTFNVKIKINSKFKNDLLRLVNNFKMGRIDDTNYLLLNADIFFTIPNNVIELIRAVCDLKYKDSELWYKYIQTFSLIETDLLNSKSGAKQTPIYKIKYTDIAVNINTDFLDTKIEREDTTFYVEMDMKFSFDIINAIMVDYPILIANQPLPKKYLIVPVQTLKSIALPITQSVLDSNVLITYKERLSLYAKDIIKQLMNNLDIEKYKELIVDNTSIEKLEAYNITREQLLTLSSNSQDYELLQVLLEEEFREYIDSLYNLNYTFKTNNPVYDMWRDYIELDGYDVTNILLLKIDEKSIKYLNIYELLNIGYNQDFIDYIIDNQTDDMFEVYNNIFNFEIYYDMYKVADLHLVKEDTYIEELDLTLKRGDLINQALLEYNLSIVNGDVEGDMVYIDLKPTYRLVIQVLYNFRLLKNKDMLNNTDLYYILQYISMDRLKHDVRFNTDGLIGYTKTSMLLSVIAFANIPTSPIISNVLKDTLKGE